MFEIISTYDWEILHWIQNTLTSPTLDFLMPKITWLGNRGMIWVVLALILIATKRYRKEGAILLIGLLIGVLVGNVFLKNLIARPRPCWIDSSVSLLISNPKDYSFPSGHTLSSVIAATVLTMSNKKFGYIAIPMAILISFSRLYLYVHFPSDVLGAYIIGLIIGIGSWNYMKNVS
ncbi:phosphatase PAP2 family protein [Tissierella creatinini]|nr:phosphatase PAP2 family protein [Tissierella creatinini]TJX60643.1 phosphatase PAP2 family protein [Soehngenia saccharolytica]